MKSFLDVVDDKRKGVWGRGNSIFVSNDGEKEVKKERKMTKVYKAL